MMKKILPLALVLLSCVALAAPKKGRVMFWYDTEDYTCPASDDGTLFHANLLTEFGFRGNFDIVGFYAQRLLELGRTDVIQALKRHAIGSQTLYHSLHPTICEYTDIEDWEAAYTRCLTQEAQAVGMLKATFGLDHVDCAVFPGNNVSPVGMYVYADLGAHVLGGAIDIFGDKTLDRLAWYCNLLQVPYHEEMDDNETLASRDLTIIYTHPNEVVTKTFWDAENYRGGNHCEWRKWKHPPLLSPEEQKQARAYWRSMMTRIKNDPRLSVVTFEDFVKELKPRVEITQADAPRLLADLKKGLQPIESPSWSISDVFQAAVHLLRGEKTFMPRKSWGFLEAPKGITQKTMLRRADILAAAKALNPDYFLPAEFAVGDQRIGPADLLIAMLEVLSGSADEITLEPRDQLGLVAKHLPQLPDLSLTAPGTWIIYAPTFKDRFITNRLRWQFWTLRYEE